jgi:lauroyl/myristoyl acyltransferase
MRRRDARDHIEVVLRSPSLYRGEFIAVEDHPVRPRKRFGGQYIKDRLQPLLYWFLRCAPWPIALFPFHIIVTVMRGTYRIRRNPLRRSCEAICRIARRAGIEHEPEVVYRQYLANVLAAAKQYRRLLRAGADEVFAKVDASDLQRVLCEEPLRDGRAFVLFVPHNLTTVVGGVALARMIPLLIVARNSRTIRRTKLALDVFERIRARILMVRGGNPFEIARAMFAALDDRQVLAATVDNVDPGFGIEARIFGVDVEFAPWAARIAAKRAVPVVPAYFHSDGNGVRIACGKPLITASPVAAIQHYVSHFERSILQDPASWAYLMDRKWSRVLQRAMPPDVTQEPMR